MDTRIEAELVAAERHITEGEQRIAQQMARIEHLAAAGLDTTQAESFFQTLLTSFAIMQKHREIILSERAGLRS